jgi:hypothetical protein
MRYFSIVRQQRYSLVPDGTRVRFVSLSYAHVP